MQPRFVSKSELNKAVFGFDSLTTLRTKLTQLEQYGFPRPDPNLGKYDLKAVHKFFDKRSGIVEKMKSKDQNLWLQALDDTHLQT